MIDPTVIFTVIALACVVMAGYGVTVGIWAVMVNALYPHEKYESARNTALVSMVLGMITYIPLLIIIKNLIVAK